MKMKALFCDRLSDDLSGVRVALLPCPVPRPDQALVKIGACALNFPDLLMTSGDYQFRPEPPFVLGMEACGTVMEAPEPGWIGRRVIVTARQGLATEQAVAPLAALRPAPDHLTDEICAAYTITGLTACAALTLRSSWRPGERLLVLGAASGVGAAALQLARHLGLWTCAVVSSAGKAALALTCGAHKTVIVPPAPNPGLALLTALKDETAAGFDGVYDPIGGLVAPAAATLLNPMGRYLVIGFAAGAIPALSLEQVRSRALSLIGVRAGELGRQDPAAGAALMALVDRLAAEGVLAPPVGARAPLDDAPSLLAQMQARTLAGKAVMLMGGGSVQADPLSPR